MGALPFPYSQDWPELFWNKLIPSRASTEEVERDMALVGVGGDIACGRTSYIQLSRYDSKGKPRQAQRWQICVCDQLLHAARA